MAVPGERFSRLSPMPSNGVENAMVAAHVPGGLEAVLNDAVTRIAMVGGLAGVALIHVLQMPASFDDTLYLGLLFVAAVVAAVVLGAALTRSGDRRVIAASGGLAALLLIGYILSRTSGLPAATDDIDNWTEPLGLASMVAEGLLICLTISALSRSSMGMERMGRPAR